jgi:hypothetical protein
MRRAWSIPLLPLLTLLTMTAWARDAAAQGGCRGFLELRPGAGGTTPPNAALVFTGYTFELPKVSAAGGGKEIPVTVETWPGLDGRCAGHHVLVRPVGGTWPAGARIEVDLGAYGKHAADIGVALDRAAPSAAKLGPARKRGPSPDGRVVSYSGVKDDTSPIALLRVAWTDHVETGSERVTIEPGASGELVYFVGRKGCAALVVVDVAGNERRFPELCRP